MDYKDTLNLPQTSFKMKANLPQKEPETEKFWKDKDIYSKIKQARCASKKYILHDGPPYANGHIHIGHALNKTLKDIVVKFKTMRNLNCDYIPGWDCHGLPVEHQLFKKLKKRKDEVGQVEFRKKAYEYAMGFVDIQREEFKRLGVFGDWENPYLTTDKGYESAIISSFAKLVEEGYIYKGLKPVNYCYRCETALAEAEVEYEDHTSPSVYVKFKVKDFADELRNWVEHDLFTHGEGNQPRGDIYFVIWTTTPWTLIANVAVALNPDEHYAWLWGRDGEVFIVADKVKSQFLQAIGKKESDYEIKYPLHNDIKGRTFEGSTYEHPFGLREGKVVLADYVSIEEGTGCVHTAPGHGQEDYITGQKYKLDVVMPVDEKGNFTDEAGEFKGMNVHKANSDIVDKLGKLRLLLHQDKITHSYPHCWRCKSPIIFRATEQWFMSIDHMDLRRKLLDEIKKVKWVPEQGRERISTMVANRPDWCLSRQRYWGVPIPVFQCTSCNKWIADAKLIKHFAEIAKKKGSDAWFELNAEALIPQGYKCPHPGCSGSDFKKGEDIIDVWFESGVSHQAVLKERGSISYPADLYLEGSDQHRGWFQSALITSMAIDKRSAFDTVLTHGFVVDGEGRKMSKSLGNVISPQDIIKHYGADILRLWVASSDYNDDIRISDKILARLTEAYRKIRNTARFILGNLYDFDPEEHSLPYEKLLEVDRWAVLRAHNLIKDITLFYEGFQFHKIYHALYNFCIIDMSNFYLDILKDRLYTLKPGSLERRSGQNAMYELLKAIVTAIAPILTFTAEEIWQSMPKPKDAAGSIHLNLWPDTEDIKADMALKAKWQELKKIRDITLKVLEEKRVSGIIGSSLEAKVKIYTESEKAHSFIKGYENDLPALFIVSQAELFNEKAPSGAFRDDKDPEISVVVEKAEGDKCKRCWNFSLSVGSSKDHPQICQRCQKVLEQMKGETR